MILENYHSVIVKDLKNSVKKHAENFFNSRRLKFNYYFIKLSSSKILKQIKYEHNTFKTQLTLKHTLGIRTKKLTYMSVFPLRSVIKFSKKYLKKHYLHKLLKYKMSVVPYFWLTAKPKAVRMGKGKGQKSKKIYFLKKGEVLYELRFLHSSSLYYNNKNISLLFINMQTMIFLKKLQHKLPVKNILIIKKF